MLHELVPADMIKLQTASDWKKVTLAPVSLLMLTIDLT